jgi:hypothetical protein
LPTAAGLTHDGPGVGGSGSDDDDIIIIITVVFGNIDVFNKTSILLMHIRFFL